MNTIEEIIQEILDEQHECRWMDTSDLEVLLRKVAEAQKAIDIDKACEWLEWIMQNGSSYGEFPSEESIKDFRKAMEDQI